MLLHNLTTERLCFRNLALTDAPAWVEFLSNPQAVKFFPPIPDVQLYSVIWIEKQLVRYAKDGFGLYALVQKDSGGLVGQCGLMTHEVDGVNELEIGYHLLPAFWKQGYAAEAAIACRNFAFENQLAESIISIIHIENFASQKVAERNGMKRDKQTLWRDSQVFIYRISREDWLLH